MPEIVEIVQETRGRPEPRYLARVFANASAYRDPAIARAALSLAEDRSAPAAAQMFGWVLAVSQVQRGLHLRSLGNEAGEWFTRDAGAVCDWANPTDVEFYRDNGLAAGFEAELKRAAQEAAENTARPANVRGFARCVAMLLPYSSDDETVN